MMFHVLTTCVSFDYVVICEIEFHFVIRKVVVPTNCVLPNHPAEHLEIMEKHTHKTLSFVEIVNKLSPKENYKTFYHEKVTEACSLRL